MVSFKWLPLRRCAMSHQRCPCVVVCLRWLCLLILCLLVRYWMSSHSLSCASVGGLWLLCPTCPCAGKVILGDGFLWGVLCRVCARFAEVDEDAASSERVAVSRTPPHSQLVSALWESQDFQSCFLAVVVWLSLLLRCAVLNW